MLDLFSNYVKCDNISFKHAKGISDHSGKEFHLFYEIVLFLGGEAEFVSETVHTKIEPQTLIVIPKETYHQFIIKGDQNEYSRCVFQFYETEENRHFLQNNIQKLIITNSDKFIWALFDKMIQLSRDSKSPFSREMTTATLTLLIDAIRNKEYSDINYELNDKLTIDAIKYINEHLIENICVDAIARQLKVSPSTLMHTFKSNMNIPIHKYIIKKRLILAHSRIAEGKSAQTVAYECGFNDYSGFYKQYKKMFDMTPSKRTKR